MKLYIIKKKDMDWFFTGRYSVGSDKPYEAEFFTSKEKAEYALYEDIYRSNEYEVVTVNFEIIDGISSKNNENISTDDIINELEKTGMDEKTIKKIFRLFDNINVGESKCFGGWYGDYIPLSKKQANIINSYGVFEITSHYEKVLDMCGYVDNNYICVKHIK